MYDHETILRNVRMGSRSSRLDVARNLYSLSYLLNMKNKLIKEINWATDQIAKRGGRIQDFHFGKMTPSRERKKEQAEYDFAFAHGYRTGLEEALNILES